MARERTRPPLTRSHPRSLLSIARSNIARSRSQRSRSSQNLMAQTCWAFNARLAPSFRPAFHGRCSLATGSYSECPIALHLLATVGQVMIERRARDEGADGREWRKKTAGVAAGLIHVLVIITK